MVNKAEWNDFDGRFREIVSDPLNLLIERVPEAGVVADGLVTLHNGHKVPLKGDGSYCGYDFSRILVINRGVHEPLEEYVFQELVKRLRPNPRMLELGAYWGHYSMWLKKVRPEANVVMVEPETICLDAGIANFKRNGYEGEFVQDFVGNGRFELDAWMERRGKLDILHADIQGYETQMLHGARQTLESRAIDYIFISTHSQSLHLQVKQALTDAKYRVEVSSDFDNETTSCDGFIFASHPDFHPVFPTDPGFSRSKITGMSAIDMLSNLALLMEGHI